MFLVTLMKFDNDYYVVSNDFRLISFNEVIAGKFPNIIPGQLCYKAMMNREEPCLHCPIAGNSDDQSPLFFNQAANKWVQANFCSLENNTFGVLCHEAEHQEIGLLNKKKIIDSISGKAANSRLNNLIEEQSKIIKGLSVPFNYLVTVDLEKMTYKILDYGQPPEEVFAKKEEGVFEIALKRLVDNNVVPEMKSQMVAFTDLSTIRERIGDKPIITQEYLDVKFGWSRAIFFPLEKNEQGEIKKLLCGSRSIQTDFIDPLTNCNTRKSLNWAYSGTSPENTIAVIVCDLNGLKSVNDQNGHSAGDEFICNVANTLSEYFGRYSVYRIGGDEFVVICLDANQHAFGRRVMEFKRQCEIDKINISIGYEFRQSFDVPFETILNEADSKMYEAKREYYRIKGFNWKNESEIDRQTSYIDSLIDFGSLNYLVCKLNLTDNSYQVIHRMEGYDTAFLNECKTLEDFFNFPVAKGIIHKDDIDDYLNYTNIEYLKKIAKESHGKLEHWIRYRSNYNKKKYHVVEAQFFSSREYSDSNQIIYAWLKDMGLPFVENRILFNDLLKELSENFESIYYINLDQGSITPYRMNDPVAKINSRLLADKPHFSKAIQFYIDNYVVKNYRQDLSNFCSEKNLREMLQIKKAISHDFLAKIDGQDVCYRIKFSNMEGAGELHHCVMGLANVNSEMLTRKELESKGKGKGILIVDDSSINRAMLTALLQEEYRIYEAENGNKAMEILKRNYKEISIVLSDIDMPECDGFELLKKIRTTKIVAEIPVIIITDINDGINKTKCLELGASDVISKPYNLKVITTRISSLISMNNIQTTLSSIEIDSLTGLYTKEAFFRYAQIILDSNTGKDFEIIVSNIVGFKAINENYGKETGDKVLSYLASTGEGNKAGFTIGGRINSDIFACLRPVMTLSKEEERQVVESVQANSPVPIILKYGIFNTKSDKDLTIQQMCDRAELAMNSIKDEYGVISANYDDSMRQKILLEQKIIENMENALKNEYFKVYYQPKFDIKTGKIAGAEALVRWLDPELGFMNPGAFIPLFEKNGFISKLDRYVWKKVCQEISYFMSKNQAFPVSINISRKDFAAPDLAEYIINLAEEFDIPHELLHIEVTESAYSGNPEQIAKTIDMLHANGFIIELDDFGTGYSSITVLNSMPIDILKLDMSIIQNDNKANGKSVLEFSMELAKMMKLKTIQEGVETQDQLSRVKNLGCDYVQGFFFAKPMDINTFKEYIKNLDNKSATI